MRDLPAEARLLRALAVAAKRGRICSRALRRMSVTAAVVFGTMSMRPF